MITEVIPKQQIYLIQSSLLHIEGYTQYLNFDTESVNLGTSDIRGTAIYVKNDIPSVEMIVLDSTYKDMGGNIVKQNGIPPLWMYLQKSHIG